MYIKEVKTFCKNQKAAYISLSNFNSTKQGKYAWPSSLRNAKLVIEHATYNSNLFELLVNHPFDTNSNLHKDFDSMVDTNEDYAENLIEDDEYEDEPWLSNMINESIFARCNQTQSQYYKTLPISSWPYQQVIMSAIWFYLESLVQKNIEYKKINLHKSKKDLIRASIPTFIFTIEAYLTFFNLQIPLLDILEEANLFSAYPKECADAYFIILTHIQHPLSRITKIKNLNINSIPELKYLINLA